MYIPTDITFNILRLTSYESIGLEEHRGSVCPHKNVVD
jgi:hypothetical protein